MHCERRFRWLVQCLDPSHDSLSQCSLLYLSLVTSLVMRQAPTRHTTHPLPLPVSRLPSRRQGTLPMRSPRRSAAVDAAPPPMAHGRPRVPPWPLNWRVCSLTWGGSPRPARCPARRCWCSSAPASAPSAPRDCPTSTSAPPPPSRPSFSAPLICAPPSWTTSSPRRGSAIVTFVYSHSIAKSVSHRLPVTHASCRLSLGSRPTLGPSSCHHISPSALVTSVKDLTFFPTHAGSYHLHIP